MRIIKLAVQVVSGITVVLGFFSIISGLRVLLKNRQDLRSPYQMDTSGVRSVEWSERRLMLDDER